MLTQNGKLLYISDNAAEYLGHSMVRQRTIYFYYYLCHYEGNLTKYINSYTCYAYSYCAWWRKTQIFSCELTNNVWLTCTMYEEEEGKMKELRKEKEKKCTKRINLFHICGRFIEILSDQCAIAWESMERVKLLPTGPSLHSLLQKNWQKILIISILAAGQSHTVSTESHLPSR